MSANQLFLSQSIDPKHDYSDVHASLSLDSKKLVGNLIGLSMKQLCKVVQDQFEILKMKVSQRKMYVLYEDILFCNPKTDHEAPKNVLPVFYDYIQNCQDSIKNLVQINIQTEFENILTQVIMGELQLKNEFLSDSMNAAYEALNQHEMAKSISQLYLRQRQQVEKLLIKRMAYHDEQEIRNQLKSDDAMQFLEMETAKARGGNKKVQLPNSILQSQLEKFQTIIQNQVEEINKLKKQLKVANQDITILKKTCDDNEIQKVDLESQIQDLQLQIEQYEQSLVSGIIVSKSEWNNRQSLLQNFQNQASCNADKFTSLTNNIQFLEQEFLKAQTKINTLDTENSALRNQLVKIQMTNNPFQKEFEDLQSQFQLLEQQLYNKNIECSELKSQIKINDAEYEALRQKILQQFKFDISDIDREINKEKRKQKQKMMGNGDFNYLDENQGNDYKRYERGTNAGQFSIVNTADFKCEHCGKNVTLPKQGLQIQYNGKSQEKTYFLQDSQYQKSDSSKGNSVNVLAKTKSNARQNTASIFQSGQNQYQLNSQNVDYNQQYDQNGNKDQQPCQTNSSQNTRDTVSTIGNKQSSIDNEQLQDQLPFDQQRELSRNYFQNQPSQIYSDNLIQQPEYFNREGAEYSNRQQGNMAINQTEQGLYNVNDIDILINAVDGLNQIERVAQQLQYADVTNVGVQVNVKELVRHGATKRGRGPFGSSNAQLYNTPNLKHDNLFNDLAEVDLNDDINGTDTLTVDMLTDPEKLGRIINKNDDVKLFIEQYTAERNSIQDVFKRLYNDAALFAAQISGVRDVMRREKEAKAKERGNLIDPTTTFRVSYYERTEQLVKRLKKFVFLFTETPQEVAQIKQLNRLQPEVTMRPSSQLLRRSGHFSTFTQSIGDGSIHGKTMNIVRPVTFNSQVFEQQRPILPNFQKK